MHINDKLIENSQGCLCVKKVTLLSVVKVGGRIINGHREKPTFEILWYLTVTGKKAIFEILWTNFFFNIWLAPSLETKGLFKEVFQFPKVINQLMKKTLK